MANEGYHEPINELTHETRDMHRAITSLMEELKQSIGITRELMHVKMKS